MYTTRALKHKKKTETLVNMLRSNRKTSTLTKSALCEYIIMYVLVYLFKRRHTILV